MDKDEIKDTLKMIKMPMLAGQIVDYIAS